MENYELIWERALKHLKVSVSTIAYSTYIEQLKPVDLIGSKLILSTKSELFASEVARRLVDKIREALKLAGTGVTDIKLYVEGSNEDYLARKGVAPVQSEIDSTPINPKYTFDTFVVGSSNRYLYAAAKAVAENPADSYNPLFIYGGAGLGKTHIMHAIANYIKQNNPLKNVLYATCEKFTSDLITTIRQGKAYSQEGMDFRNKYRNVDVLIIDDVQFLAKKQSTQEEFFHTFNELYKQGKQIVLTSDRPPKEIKILEERIRNRFESGLIADVSPPDYETRMAIIRRKAELLNLNIPDDVCEFIANRLKTNIRQLEGAVNKMSALRNFSGNTPTMATAQSVIRDILNDDQPTPITVEKIISNVAEIYNVTPEEIRSNKRSAQISMARKVAIYVVREITQMPLVAIGHEFGNRDHSTIVYSINSIENSIKKDKNLKQVVEDCIKNIRICAF